jgi:hypothetical protein
VDFYFLRFFAKLAAEAYALFAVLQQASKGGGEVNSDQRSRTTSQAFLKLSWSRLWPASPSLTFLNMKKSPGARFGVIGQVFFLYFCKAFASSGEIGDEVSYSLHTWAEVGGGGII